MNKLQIDHESLKDICDTIKAVKGKEFFALVETIHIGNMLFIGTREILRNAGGNNTHEERIHHIISVAMISIVSTMEQTLKLTRDDIAEASLWAIRIADRCGIKIEKPAST